jgi:predicted  nucleic acid-binding Zn-ribbon protein
MDKKDVYREKLEAQLKEWKAKIDLLETRLSSLSSDAKNELIKEIKDLRQRKTVVREKWNELQKTGGEAWDKLKDGTEKASVELKEKLDKVISRFK